MKKFLLLFLVFVMAISQCVFADDEVIDDVESIYNYEDYEDLLSNYGYSQEELASEYEDFMTFMADMGSDYYASPNIYRAKVLNDADVTTYYQADQYLIYKVDYQNLDVELLDGADVGKNVSVKFFLTYDSLGNIEIPSAKKGDIIYLKETGDTEEPYMASDTFLNVEKRVSIYVLGAIAMLLVIVYGRREGLLSALISLFIIVTLLLIVVPAIVEGARIEWLAPLFAVCITILVSIKLCGLNKATIFVSGTSIAITTIGAGLTYLVDILTKNRGTTMDVMLIAETIVKRNLNFHMFYVGGIALMLSVIVPIIVKRVYDIYTENREKSFGELLVKSKDVMGALPEIVTVILMVLSMPMLLMLEGYGYKYGEIISSDMIQAECIRLFIILIVMALAIPGAVTVCKCIMQNKNETVENPKEEL